MIAAVSPVAASGIADMEVVERPRRSRKRWKKRRVSAWPPRTGSSGPVTLVSAAGTAPAGVLATAADSALLIWRFRAPSTAASSVAVNSRSDSSGDPNADAAAASAGRASTASRPASTSASAANAGTASAWDAVSMVGRISAAGAASAVVRISTAGGTSDRAASAASAATAASDSAATAASDSAARSGAALLAGGPGAATIGGGAASTRTSVDGHDIGARLGGDDSAKSATAVSGPTTVTSGNAAGRTSRLRSGAQERHSPAALFQQLRQVYCRQVKQKLNV